MKKYVQALTLVFALGTYSSLHTMAIPNPYIEKASYTMANGQRIVVGVSDSTGEVEVKRLNADGTTDMDFGARSWRRTRGYLLFARGSVVAADTFVPTGVNVNPATGNIRVSGYASRDPQNPVHLQISADGSRYRILYEY